MSIVGEPQETHTVKSSWEVLDSPVPFHQPRLQNRRQQSSSSQLFDGKDKKEPQSDYQEQSDLRRDSSIESAGISNEHTVADSNDIERNICGESRLVGYNIPNDVVSPHEPDDTDRDSVFNQVDTYARTDDQHSGIESANRDIYREIQTPDRGAATYVSTQQRQVDNIADTIAAEFEQHARRSQSSHRRGFFENTTQHFHNDIIKELSEIDTHSQHIQTLLEQSTNIRLQEDTIQSTELNQQIDQRSRDADTDSFSGATIVAQETRNMSQVSVARGVPEVRTMSASSSVNNINDVPPTDNGQGIENVSNAHTNSDTRTPSSVRLYGSSNQSRQRRRSNISQQSPVNRQRPGNLASHNNTNMSDTSLDSRTNRVDEHNQTEHNQPSTSSRDTTFEGTSRSVPDGGDFPPVRIEAEQEISPPGPTIASPIFHPPPTIVQNGISQRDLLELMSKGLGNFTTEMAVMVIDKLKPEYDTIAKKVGNEVKEATVSELKNLREKLKETEYKLESISDERDLLKTENIKERDLIKREFEKDRLKRVKEFEEKNELIDKLKTENEKLKNNLKDKDKYLKKAESKAKTEEAKRIKSEEESEKRQKDLQKELDKAKGEILVLKSKKRVQVTSAAKSRKETLLGRLNSNYGKYPRHFNGHLPYDEGDD